MFRIAVIMILASFTIPAFALSAAGLVVHPGQWSTLIEIFDNSQNHYLLKTSVNDDPEACLMALQDSASQIKHTSGFVWINRDKSVVNYESKPDTSDKVRVLQLRCALEPVETEITKLHW